jgi:GPH family glycoside/pentoside/hexuronide:cation symporter
MASHPGVRLVAADLSLPALSDAKAGPSEAAAVGIPIGVQVGWGLGSLGTVIVLYLQSVFLLFFLTSVLGMRPGVAGTLILAAKLFDLAWGLAVGRLSDRAPAIWRSKTPRPVNWGRRRPFLAAGAIVSVIGIMLVFCPPIVAAPYQIFTLIVLGLGYGLFNVPYLAMPAEMADSAPVRTRLMSWRIIFVSLGTLFTGSVLPLVVRWAGGGRPGFTALAELSAGLVGASMLAAVLTTGRARFHARTEARPGQQSDWAAIWSNRPFLLLMAAKVTQLVGLAVGSAILLFFFTSVLGGRVDSVSLWSLVAYSVSIATTPLWARIAAVAEKRALYIAACVAYGIVTLSWLLAGPGQSVVLIVLRAVLVGPSIACLLLMGQSMLTDVIAYDRARSGVGREGVYAAIYNFVEKGSSAAGPFVVGWVLQFVGFHAGANAGAPQTPEALRGVYLAMAVIPGALYMISTVPLFFYDLSERRLAAMPPRSP